MSFDLEKIQPGPEESEGSNPFGEILGLAERLKSLAAEIKEDEEALKAKIKEHKNLAEVVLVEAMDNLGVTSFTLDSGHTLKRLPFIHGKIKDPETAFNWLKEQGEEGIIKGEVKAKLKAGESELGEEIVAWLAEKQIASEYKETVHPQTLGSFLREVKENEELYSSLPKEAFGVYEGEIVKITEPTS